MRNCTVQPSKFTHELEVLANSKTTISKSPKRFNVDESLIQTASTTSDDINIIMSDLQDLAMNQRVNIVGKVIHMEPPMKVQSGPDNHLLKQDFTLVDCDGACRAVLWENKVSCLEINQSYRIKRMLLSDTLIITSTFPSR